MLQLPNHFGYLLLYLSWVAAPCKEQPSKRAFFLWELKSPPSSGGGKCHVTLSPPSSLPSWSHPQSHLWATSLGAEKLQGGAHVVDLPRAQKSLPLLLFSTVLLIPGSNSFMNKMNYSGPNTYPCTFWYILCREASQQELWNISGTD